MIEHDDTTGSNTTAKLLELLGEGEIGGPAIENNWYKSTYFDGIPVQNLDGSFNFEGVTIEGRTGTIPQDYIASLDGIESATLVALAVTYGHPLSRTITNTDVDNVKIAISIPILMNQNNKYGDVNAGVIQLAIYVTPGGGSGTPQLVVDPETTGYIHEKHSSEYRKQYIIENISQYGSAPWVITVERTNPDSETLKVVDAFGWYSYTTVIDTKLQYYGRAVAGISLDSRSFGTQMPARAYRLNGRKIKIPSNYDPIARTYSGDWDGTFVIAVSNNPAWVVYDLLVETEACLGTIITEDMVDKWELYSCGQYCDELITTTNKVKQDDGSYTEVTTSEPRFSFNAPIEVRVQGLEAVVHVCSAMRAYPVWIGNQVSFVQDRPVIAPARPVGPSNVEDGLFEYTGIPRRNRHSVVKVSWNNPDLLGKLDVIELINQQAVIDFGYNEIDFVAIGCTSRTEAIRRGRFVLDTDVNAREAVSFKGGLEWADAIPGELVAVQDPNYAAVTLEGRVKSGTTTSLILDKDIEIESGVTYTMLIQISTTEAEERVLTNAAEITNELTWSSPLPEVPFIGAQLVISASNLSTRPFSIISVTEEDGFYVVSGVQYDEGKYDRIDYGIITDSPTYTKLLPHSLLPPTNLTLTPYSYVVGEQVTRMKGLLISWTPPNDPRVMEYEVKLESSLGAKYYGKTTQSSIDWRDAGDGLYNVRVRSVGVGLYSTWLIYSDFDFLIDFNDLEPKTDFELALIDIQNAQSVLEDWASDGWFSPIEKMAFRDGWLIRTAQFLSLKSQADIYSVDHSDLSSSFAAWGTYLNAGSAWSVPSTYPPTDASLPLWIRLSQLGTAVEIDRTDFVTYGSSYLLAMYNLEVAIYEAVHAFSAGAQAAAEQAASDANDAVSILDQWGVDEWFSPIEKAAFYNGWIVRTEEYLDLKAQATAFSLDLSALSTPFAAWGTYLNDGVSWSIPTSVSDSTFPSWIKQVNLATSTAIVRSEFASTGEVYLAAVTAMKTAIANAVGDSIANAQADAAFAKGVLDDWATDGLFTFDEKKAFREGWFTRTAEYLDVKSQAATFSVSSTALVNAMNAWGTYLNAGSSWTAPTSYPPSDASLPLWIQKAQLPITVTIDRATFDSKGNTYLDALIALKVAIAGQAKSDTNTAATTAAWTGVSSRPTTLLALNNTDGTKLSGIETGADVTTYTKIQNELTNNSLTFSGMYSYITFSGLYSEINLSGIYSKINFSNFYISGLSGSGASFVASSNRIDLYTASGGININVGYSGANVILDCGSYSNDNAGIIDFRTSGTSRFFIKPTGLFPRSDNAMYLGYSANRLKEIWCVDGTIHTSDEKEKSFIEESDLGLEFINKLSPKKWIWNDGVRTHYGLVAQDVENVILTDSLDFAGLIKNNLSIIYRDVENVIEKEVTNDYGELIKFPNKEITTEKITIETKDIQNEDTCLKSYDSYGLRYHEFIGPMIKAIQEMSLMIDELKAEIKTLKGIK